MPDRPALGQEESHVLTKGGKLKPEKSVQRDPAKLTLILLRYVFGSNMLPWASGSSGGTPGSWKAYRE